MSSFYSVYCKIVYRLVTTDCSFMSESELITEYILEELQFSYEIIQYEDGCHLECDTV
jgi:hypothetical protein